MPGKVTKAKALADIRRVADELGHPPTIAEYREHGQYSAPTAAKFHDRRFTDARAAALDMDSGRQPEHRRDELVADIQRVAEIVGGEPSKRDYQDHGEYALSGITYRFDSWVAAKQAAGVYDGLDDGPTREDVLEDMQRVDTEQSGPLSQKVYDEHGEWTSMATKRRFESWEAACQKAGVERPQKGPRPEDDADLLDDIRSVAEELGRAPSRSEYNEHGQFSRGMARVRFDSWPEAVEAAGFDALEPGGPPGEYNGHWSDITPYYGPDWNQRAAYIRNRDGHECLACGMSNEDHSEKFGSRLNVHHIKKARNFDDYQTANRPENLVTLCNSCHKQYEHLPNERAKKLLVE